MSFIALLVGVFGVFAGWHWKLLHRAVRDVARYKDSVRVAQKVEREHWGRAVLFGVAALIILFAVAKMH
ncbi:MAG: hypothetical protein JO345_31910 [Streptosporangiaceae bacterium]|nr:hypothetical protein [Streptosporangiaceae bacterium]